jgi:transposase-like protein
MKNYQTTTRRAGNGRTTPRKARLDVARSAHESAVSLPDTVTGAIAELAGELEEGLLAVVVSAGLKALDLVLESEATALAGEKGRHDPNRTAVRHGDHPGLVALGGRQVSINRPRLRTADKTAEVGLPTYELAASTELLERETMARMLAKLSTRRYRVGLEPMGAAVTAKSRSVSKSAVSRRFVAATESALAELMAADLSELELVAIMVDGVNFAQHLCVVALGIAVDGTKHPLGLVEGDTENATVVKRLLVSLRDRGLDTTKPTLFVLDGAKALSSAVKAVFDHPVIARCEEHYVERRIMWTAEGRPWQRRRAA